MPTAPQQSGPTSSSSSSHLYQQTYGLSRSVTLPESQHQSRRSNSYSMSVRQMNNDDDMQHDGKMKQSSSQGIAYLIADRHHGRQRRPSVETAR
jgi:hypothetical protein